MEKRTGFLRVFELLLRQSGGMLDVTKLSEESQISRPTITNWLEVPCVRMTAACCGSTSCWMR